MYVQYVAKKLLICVGDIEKAFIEKAWREAIGVKNDFLFVQVPVLYRSVLVKVDFSKKK